jgi:hypothetical protein
MDGPKLSEDTGDPPRRSAGLHQPWRSAVAGIELVVAAGLVFVAWWAWRNGFVMITLPEPDGSTDVVTRSVGSWLTGAVAAATVAGLLVIDAFRQVVLALRVRQR